MTIEEILAGESKNVEFKVQSVRGKVILQPQGKEFFT